MFLTRDNPYCLQESSITDGVSTSLVDIKVSRDDNGALVSCTAHNPAVEMPKPPTNTTTLVVYCEFSRHSFKKANPSLFAGNHKFCMKKRLNFSSN